LGAFVQDLLALLVKGKTIASYPNAVLELISSFYAVAESGEVRVFLKGKSSPASSGFGAHLLGDLLYRTNVPR
jgi:hypothetical protein